MHTLFVPISDITIPERLRSEMESEGNSPEAGERSLKSLKNSIQTFGLLNPITITRDLVLVAGRRRLQAHIMAGLPEIRCTLLEDRSPEELVAIETEENVRRLDMPWPDRVKGYQKYHNMQKNLNPAWSMTMTAEALNLSQGTISRALSLASALDHNPLLARSPTITSAYARVQQATDRLLDSEIAEMMQKEDHKPEAHQNLTDRYSILHRDFLDFASSYSGPPFQFLHCDFPYGINIQDSKIMHTGAHIDSEYHDGFEILQALLHTLIANFDRLVAPQAHIMFWFSMRHYNMLLNVLSSAGLLPNHLPLVWFKTDGAGIAPDVTRGPRQVYETALLVSRGDRKIVRPVANCYGAPSVSGIHSSIKPEPMLRHFFQMFIDDSTRVLDPTCGSGSAIRAAQSGGARSALGLELNGEFAKRAQTELSLHLRKATL